MYWLPLTLFCAFALATSDAAAKRWLSDASTVELTLVRIGLSGFLILPLAFLQPLPDLPVTFWLWMLLLAPLEITAMMLYMKAIRDYPLSLTVPYLAFTPVFVLVTGWIVLGEAVSLTGLGGILLVVTGSWLLNYQDNWRNLLAPFKATVRNHGSRLMLLTAAIYAVTSVGGKAAMTWMPAEQFGPFYFGLVGALSFVVFAAHRRSYRIFFRKPRASLLVASLMGIMVISHFIALSMVEAAYMITIKRTSMLFGILYGVLIFGEHHALQHFLAASLMVLGVGMVALS